MEVELDVVPQRETVGQCLQHWGRSCQRVWLCQHEELFKDEPMAPADWDRHMSWRRHCFEPRVCFRVVRMLSIWEAWVLAASLAAQLYQLYLQPRPGWPVLVSKDHNQVFVLTSFALALLMVFRTNAASGRWWEARTAIGRWLNVVRNSQRMLLSWAPPGDAAIVSEYARWNAAFTAAASYYLCRDESYLDVYCGDLLTNDEVAWLKRCANPPVKVLMVMSQLVARTGLSATERAEVEREISAGDISLGALERITRQAIPRAYTRHTSRFLITYLTCLPFGLGAYMGWLTLPVMVVLTFLLMGIENIGVQIENPVRVLPMDRFSAGNKAAVLLMVQHAGAVTAVMEAGLSAALAGKARPPAAPVLPGMRPAGAPMVAAAQAPGMAR
ncbi:hypothetical protein Rsub_00881 [Raphidocelis subcapitata]|uniref:Uncharacterized protein n=1 Tax=Raphidocelis subcapitata TaxID=307507 RepID=A0A2V0NM02_9CHLO|nr:hypothetical protein Rsub_00881 [Raphidocelis subcapitata]|eukprot:GBF88169.1 hypothetical protein Rsub_00881 [Raphidocelis subcapitata]